jgi:ABC-type transporter Mla subunit MlaD
MMRVSRELKIGVFLAVVLAIMAFFIFTVGDLGRVFRKPGYPLLATFDTAAGVDPGVLVRVAGIKVGRVKSIELVGTKARFTLEITPSFRVPLGSRATQSVLGLLGEKYIEIKPGDGPGYCEPGGELETTEPIGFDQVGSLFLSIGNEIKELSATLKDVAGPESRAGVKAILANMSAFSAELRDFMAANKDGLGRSIRDADRAIADLSARMTETLAAVRGLADDNRESVRTSLTRVQDVLSRMEEAVTLMKSTLDKVDKGQGTLGKLVNDPGLYGKAEETVDRVRTVLGPVAGMTAELGVEASYYGESDKLKGALSLALRPSPTALVLAGIVHDPWRDRFAYSLQGGLRWMGLRPRAGLIESEFGVGLDWLAFRDRVVLSLEGFDFNREGSPRLRLFGRWRPFDHLSVLLGMDDVVEDGGREVFFGVGVQSR